MKDYPFCPVCGAEDSVKKITRIKTINIRGKDISVETEVYECENCGEAFASLDKTFDFINQARQQYRIMFNIPSPEEIRDFMDKYNFSLRDMEKLTGIAFKTIDRYLKGAIPDPSNIKFFKLLLNNPETVLFLMNEDEHFKAPKFNASRELLEKEIKEKHREDCPICKIEITTSTQSWMGKFDFPSIYRKYEVTKKSVDIFKKLKFILEQEVKQKMPEPLYSLNLAPSLSVSEEIGCHFYYPQAKIKKEEQEEKEDQFSYAG